MEALPGLSDQLRQAEDAFSQGKWEEALTRYLSIVRTEPRFAKARFRMADTLLNLGYADHAKKIYRDLAWDHIRGGRPLLGIVAAKMVLALDPHLEDILVVLAEMYSADSDRTSDVAVPNLPPLSEDAVLAPVSELGEELIQAAVRAAAEVAGIDEAPQTLPRIPLFSHLGATPFLAVLQSLRLRRYADGDVVIQEGDAGHSFYILVDGEVSIWRNGGRDEVLLARLGRGAVFGEMALVSRAARVATVRATGEIEALELTRGDLEEYAGQLESVREALRKFTRGRFLANLAATSPLFAHLSLSDQRSLLAMFRAQRVFPGDIIIEQGEKARGLYLVLSGQMRVVTEGNNRPTELAVLRSGDVFGEMSLLYDVPTMATVQTMELGELLFLPQADFREVLVRYPKMVETLNVMSEGRLAVAPKGGVTDDASVMV
ncbi:MAG: cyclic nucleotide-binding domain-containing protein [Myxococcales bacterium]|nr:cyclic nucleotide-binding domain-containing protein [Myxococcales bacterium]